MNLSGIHRCDASVVTSDKKPAIRIHFKCHSFEIVYLVDYADALVFVGEAAVIAFKDSFETSAVCPENLIML